MTWPIVRLRESLEWAASELTDYATSDTTADQAKLLLEAALLVRQASKKIDVVVDQWKHEGKK